MADPLSALITGGATLLGGLMQPTEQNQLTATIPHAFTGQTGLGQTGYHPDTGFFSSLAPQFQGISDTSAAAAKSMLGRAGAYDPTISGQGLFSQYYQPMLARQQAEQRNALENRLFQQGRLGSTGGATQQRALEEAAAMQNLQAMQAARQQALGEQQGMYTLGQGLFSTAMMPQQQLLNQMSVLGGLAPRMSSSEAGSSGGLFGNLGNIGQALQTSPAGQVYQQAGLPGAALTAVANPMSLVPSTGSTALDWAINPFGQIAGEVGGFFSDVFGW